VVLVNVEDKIGLAWCGAAVGVLFTFVVWAALRAVFT
jgi:hypothetical protein